MSKFVSLPSSSDASLTSPDNHHNFTTGVTQAAIQPSKEDDITFMLEIDSPPDYEDVDPSNDVATPQEPESNATHGTYGRKRNKTNVRITIPLEEVAINNIKEQIQKFKRTYVSMFLFHYYRRPPLVRHEKVTDIKHTGTWAGHVGMCSISCLVLRA